MRTDTHTEVKKENNEKTFDTQPHLGPYPQLGESADRRALAQLGTPPPRLSFDSIDGADVEAKIPIPPLYDGGLVLFVSKRRY